MDALEQWLSVATRELTPESVGRVRGEIEEHYGSAMASGATAEEAIAALGDAKAANGQYKKVLLTVGEARILHLMRGEIPPGLTARRVTSGKWLAGILFVEAIAGMFGAMMLGTGWRYFCVTLIGLMFLQTVLPLQTVKRARIFSWTKWLLLLAASIPLFATYWWAPIGALMGLLYGDYRKMVLRRKVPREQWPKRLYL